HAGRLREALAQELAERRVELDQHEPRRRDAMLDQRLGNRPRAGTKLDHRPFAIRIDVLCHGAGEGLARRCDGADRKRLLDPRTDEADLIVEADAVLLLEAAKMRLDVAADRLFDAAERHLHLLLEML